MQGFWIFLLFGLLYYYKELSWNYNDTHGIGIILLAGTEMIRLEEFLGREEQNA